MSESEVYVYDLAAPGGPAFQSVVAPVPADLSTLEDLAEQDWVDCEWVDGFFLLFAASGQFWHSNIDSIQFDQLDFSQAGDMPDQIVAGEILNSRLYIIGSKSIENWYNAGLADFAFARDNSFSVNVGCVARATIAKNPVAITFLGNDLIVYMLGGGQPIRVSTESVEYDIKRSEPGKARAFVYQEEGHYFYSLTLEYADATKKNWTLDFTTGVWHERSQTDILCVTTWGKKQTIVGRDGHEHIFDFRLDWGVIEDDTTGEGNISREAVGPVMFADFHRVTMKSFQVPTSLPGQGGMLTTPSRSSGPTTRRKRGRAAQTRTATRRHTIWMMAPGSG